MAERSDLVLRARVVLLRNSLWRVNNALKDLGQSRPNPFDEVRQKVQREAKAAREALQEMSSPDPELLTALNAINTIISATTPGSPEAAAGGASQVLSMLQSDTARTIRDELEYGFKQRSRSWRRSSRPPMPRARSAQSADQLDREAWRLFTECLEKCQELFAEYLDLVRGVLVRDAGLDRDLFRIADDLVRRTTIAEYRWES